MTDDRPSTPHADARSFEIPLDGDGPLAGADRTSRSESDQPAGNERKIGGLAVLGGVGIGVLSAAVLIGFVGADDQANEVPRVGASTTIGHTDAASLITAPATLPVRVPGAPAREGPLLDQIVVPGYPSVIGDVETSPDSFDLYTAVSELGADVARRSSTRLELGVGGFVSEHTILRDPATARYLVTRGQATMIVDEASGLTYVDASTPEDEQWLPVDDRLLAESVGAASIGQLHRQLMLGPIRPDTISSATVTVGDFVLIDDQISVAREFTVTVPAALIPEWQLYAFGPTSEFVASDLPSRLTYTVYVDERNQIRRVVGLSDLGGIPQLVVHDLGALAEGFVVELPEPATINTGPPR